MIVYVYTFPNGKQYVGLTTQSFYSRTGSDGKRYKGQLVYEAIKKYGWDNIDIDWVECETEDEMNELEEYLIEALDTLTPNGYNVQKGGYHNYWSDELKQKASIIQKEHYKNHPEHAQKISAALKEYHQTHTISQETRDKMSNNNKASKPVICIETNTYYKSAAEAGRQFSLNSLNLRKLCNGTSKAHTFGGYHWRWATEEEIKENQK